MSIEFLKQPQVHLQEDTTEEGERLLKYVVRAGVRSGSGELQNEIVATAKCRIFEYPPLKVFKIEKVDVHEDARSHRLSSMLMRTIETDIREEGAVGMLKDMVGYFKGTPGGAIGMYERKGWKVLGKNYSTYLTFNAPDDPATHEALNRVLTSFF